MKFLAQVFVGSNPFLQEAVSWGVGIVVLLLSLGVWLMWWYLGKQSKS